MLDGTFAPKTLNTRLSKGSSFQLFHTLVVHRFSAVVCAVCLWISRGLSQTEPFRILLNLSEIFEDPAQCRKVEPSRYYFV